LTIFEWFFNDAASAKVQERMKKAIALQTRSAQEDIGLCESVQRG